MEIFGDEDVLSVHILPLCVYYGKSVQGVSMFKIGIPLIKMRAAGRKMARLHECAVRAGAWVLLGYSHFSFFELYIARFSVVPVTVIYNTIYAL